MLFRARRRGGRSTLHRSPAARGWAAAAVLLWAGGADAASMGLDPPASTCGPSSCGPLAVQVSLLLGENGTDGFEFEWSVTNAAAIGLTPGPVGTPAAGFSGGVSLLGDGVTLVGSLISNPDSFDGPTTVSLASLGLSAVGVSGTTAEFRFTSAEISCSTCNGGAGAIHPVSNVANELLGTVTIVPEPGTFALLASGLGLLAAFGRGRGAKR